jgi:type II secretory pathway pseudopilin PulG
MRTHRTDAGFSLAALIFFLTAASIVIAAAVPAYQMQAKREMEAELIFRGEEYQRAIQRYRNRFGVYPSTIDQLISTNGLRFLRRAYKDPMTDKAFRLITLNPSGGLTGSKTYMQNMNQPLFGAPQLFGNTGGAGNTNAPQLFGNTGGAGNTSPPPGNATGGRGNPFGGRGANPAAGPRGAGSSAGAGTGINPFSNTPTVTSGGNQPFATSGIVGVASDNEKESIKIYNGRQKYDEWEFLAILGQNNPNGPFPPAANPGNNPFGAGVNPFGPGGPGPRGAPYPPGSGGPFGGAPGSPTGNTPGGISGPRGIPPAQNPFGGFGGPPPQQPPVAPRN